MHRSRRGSAREPVEAFDGYVLLDAQDWMSHAQMAELWAEITRTAKTRRPGHLPHRRR